MKSTLDFTVGLALIAWYVHAIQVAPSTSTSIVGRGYFLKNKYVLVPTTAKEDLNPTEKLKDSVKNLSNSLVLPSESSGGVWANVNLISKEKPYSSAQLEDVVSNDISEINDGSEEYVDDDTDDLEAEEKENLDQQSQLNRDDADAYDDGEESDDEGFAYPSEVASYVQGLEEEAIFNQQANDLLPEVMSFLKKALTISENGDHSLASKSINSTRTDDRISTGQKNANASTTEETKHEEQDIFDDEEDENYTTPSNLASLDLPEDISYITEDIADEIEAGVEESLKISEDDAEFRADESTENSTLIQSEERRQFPLYLFQGTYIPEPRLNRFIDGAVRNMGTEVRIASMDPLYFRVLPKGHVELSEKPVDPKTSLVTRNRRRKKINRNRRRRKPMGRSRNKRQANRRRGNRPASNRRRNGITTRLSQLLDRRRRQKVRRQRLEQQRRKERTKRRRNRRKQQQNLRKNRRRNKSPSRRTKFRRRVKRRVRYVGGGRVDGISKVVRDGDSEMQLFGNYTLIRSHMTMGPVELTMQFRTRRGLKQTGATLPSIKIHTVTRVNQEGSEMIDFLLDRPHPETIAVRGNLYPLAERVARNIFARLFLSRSFLVQKLREKCGLALLSKPSHSTY